jgi:hypothetical protein
VGVLFLTQIGQSDVQVRRDADTVPGGPPVPEDDHDRFHFQHPDRRNEVIHFREWGKALLDWFEANGGRPAEEVLESFRRTIATPLLDAYLERLERLIDRGEAIDRLIFIASKQEEDSPYAPGDTFLLASALEHYVRLLGQASSSRAVVEVEVWELADPASLAGSFEEVIGRLRRIEQAPSKIIVAVSGGVPSASYATVFAALSTASGLAGLPAGSIEIEAWEVRGGRAVDYVLPRLVEIDRIRASYLRTLRTLIETRAWHEALAQLTSQPLPLLARGTSDKLRLLGEAALAIEHFDPSAAAATAAACARAGLPPPVPSTLEDVRDRLAERHTNLRPAAELLFWLVKESFEANRCAEALARSFPLIEYLLHLAYESVCGHPLEARRLAKDTQGSKWPGAAQGLRGCPRRGPLRERMQVAAQQGQRDRTGERYLLETWSRLNEVVASCFLTGRVGGLEACTQRDCLFRNRLGPEDRDRLARRALAWAILRRGDLMTLRNRSAIAHGFERIDRTLLTADLAKDVDRVIERLAMLQDDERYRGLLGGRTTNRDDLPQLFRDGFPEQDGFSEQLRRLCAWFARDDDFGNRASPVEVIAETALGLLPMT